MTFTADFYLFQPVDAPRSNGAELFEVLNRGRKLASRMLNHAPPVAMRTANIPTGDGFPTLGWTIAGSRAS